MGEADFLVGRRARRSRQDLLRAIVFAGVVLWASSVAHAQNDPIGQDEASTTDGFAFEDATLFRNPTATAVRAEAPPVIDGHLDDPIWRTATPVTRFFQRPGRAIEGAPPSELTAVHIAYDDQRLYFGIHAYYSDPTQIRASRVDRDQIQLDDKVTIYLDPFLDLQRAYAFAVNPYGVQRDAVLIPTGPRNGDVSWNTLFETAGQLVEDGWTAEMAIPFKSLRYPGRGPGEEHLWGLQIERDIESRNEAVTWMPISSSVMGFTSQMGVLEGLTDLSTNRNLEFLPTVTAIQLGTLDSTTGRFGNDHLEEAGFNVKYGLTPNLTFDFTLNPDYSQIESDRPQIEVNQRFPVFFPELRPFFLEGQEIYSVPGPVRLVHTRTVVDPRYGAKFSGKSGRTTLALLIADDEAPGKVDDPADPAFGESAQVLNARAKFDLQSRSYVGAVFTDREFLDSYSRLGGIDGDLWFGNNYRFTFAALASDRRDLNNVRRTGPLWNVAFQRDTRNLDLSVDHYQIHPDFGTDLGFVRRVDQRFVAANGSYTWWPGTWVVNWGPRFTYERGYRYRGGPVEDERIQGGLNAQFTNSVMVRANVDRIMERYREIDFHKTRFSASGLVNTSRKIAVQAEMSIGDEIHFVANPYLGRTIEYEFGVTLRPSSRLQSQISLDTTRFMDAGRDTEIFNIKILHAVTTYQFTDRLLIRNILDHDTFDKTFFASFLLTYRVNAGTVFYVGYDDHRRQGNLLNPAIFPRTDYERTNRAVFMKLQYLLRY